MFRFFCFKIIGISLNMIPSVTVKVVSVFTIIQDAIRPIFVRHLKIFGVIPCLLSEHPDVKVMILLVCNCLLFHFIFSSKKNIYSVYFNFSFLVVSDHYHCFENIVVLKDFPKNVCCRNCGTIIGKLNRERLEITLFSFRIMRVAPYEFSQTCCMSEEIVDHSHNFSLWSKIMNLGDGFRINPIYNYYCRTRRLTSPCRFSPGPRVLFHNNESDANKTDDLHITDTVDPVRDVLLPVDDIVTVVDSPESQPISKNETVTETADDDISKPPCVTVSCDNFAYEASYQYTTTNFDIDVSCSNRQSVEPVLLTSKPSISNPERDAISLKYQNLESIASTSTYQNLDCLANTLHYEDIEPNASSSHYEEIEPIAGTSHYEDIECIASTSHYEDIESIASTSNYGVIKPIASTSHYEDIEFVTNTLSYHNLQPVVNISCRNNIKPTANTLSYLRSEPIASTSSCQNTESVATSNIDCHNESFDDSSNYTIANFDQRMNNILRNCLFGDDSQNVEMPVLVSYLFFVDKKNSLFLFL